MKRAKPFRIHHKNRMIKKAINLLTNIWFFGDDRLKETAKRLSDNIKTCSCDMCKNRRRVLHGTKKDRLTVQERKHECI